MPHHRITRRLALSCLAFGPAAAARAWESPAFPNWSDSHVDKILTDSPWARTSTVSFELRDGSAPSVRTEIFLTTRWASALPVRQAMAMEQFGREGLQSKKAQELLNGPFEEYVVEVAGFPVTIIRQGAEKFEAELLKTARLAVSGRPPVSATSATVPPHGMHLMATLRFPRLADLSVDQGVIELTADARPLKIRERFKLKDMLYAGRLEL